MGTTSAKYAGGIGTLGRLTPWEDTRKPSLTQLSRLIGACVYFIRCEDGTIKIGHTTNIAARKRKFGSGWEHILAIVPGTIDDEHALHGRFAEHLAHGQEYFHPVPELIEHINEIRERMGVEPIAA